MGTYFDNTKADSAGTLSQTKPLSDLQSSGKYRDIKGNPFADFVSGKSSLEDAMGQITGSQVYDPTKGPQVDSGGGAQPIGNFQTNPGVGTGFSGTANGVPFNSQSTQPAGNVSQGNLIPPADLASFQKANPGLDFNNEDLSAYRAAGSGTPPVNPNALGQAAFKATKGTGIAAPQDAGSAASKVQGALSLTQAQQPKQPPPISPTVDNFFTQNPAVQQSTQDLMTFLSPQALQDDVFSQMKKLVGDQSQFAAEKMQYMNIQNIMAGTPDDIRDEVTKAGGFASESQVQALSIARNKTLVKQATLLQNQMSLMQDAIQNDTTLLNFEKDQANTQFTQRMGILNYQQTNQMNMLNAAKDSVKMTVDALGWDGAYAAYSTDPAQMARLEQISGMTAGGLKQAATQAAQERKQKTQMDALDIQAKKATIANSYSEIAKRNFDMTNAGSGLDEVIAANARQTTSGMTYIDGTNFGAKEALEAQKAAAKAGIPYLDKTSADLQNNVETARQNMANISQSLNGLLAKSGSDVFTRLKNVVESKTQTGKNAAELASFNAYRSAAIQALRAMAGAKGLRINQAEILQSVNQDIPKITDSVGVAQAKINKVNSLLDAQEKGTFGSQYYNPTQTSPDTAGAYTAGGKTYTKGPDGLYYAK